MLGYAVLNESSVALRASPSAPVDCQPDRTTVPVMLCGSNALVDAGAEAGADTGVETPDGLAPPPDGDGVAPLLQALKTRVATAAVATARMGGRMFLLHACCVAARAHRRDRHSVGVSGGPRVDNDVTVARGPCTSIAVRASKVCESATVSRVT